MCTSSPRRGTRELQGAATGQLEEAERAPQGRRTFHKLEVLLEDAFRKAREQAGAAQITVALEVRSVLESTRQGSLAERRVGEDTNSELFARIQDAVVLHA